MTITIAAATAQRFRTRLPPTSSRSRRQVPFAAGAGVEFGEGGPVAEDRAAVGGGEGRRFGGEHAVAFGRRQGAVAAGALQQLAVQGEEAGVFEHRLERVAAGGFLNARQQRGVAAEDGGRVEFLGRQPEAPPAGAQPGPLTRQQRGDRGREDQSQHHRGQPRQGGRRGEGGGEGRQHADRRGRPVVRPRPAERDRLLPAGLRVPLHDPAGQRGGDEPAVEQHHHRGDEGRQQRLADDPRQYPPAAAELLQRPGPAGGEDGVEFRQDEHPHADAEQRQPAGAVDALHPVHPRGGGEQRQDQERQPERAGDVPHHAHRQVQDRHRLQPAAGEDVAVLQVPLAPPLVAFGPVQQGRGALLVAAGEVLGEANAPPGAAHQGGLDKVVAQNLPAQRGDARQDRQVAVVAERGDPQDCVVTPIISLAAGPEREAPQERRGIQFGRELLPAGQHAHPADGGGRGLQDAAGGVGGDAAGHLDQRGPGHQAVGVERHHEVVVVAPPLHEFGDVARLARAVLGPVPVVDVLAGRQGVVQFRPGPLLGQPDGRVRAVRQQEEVEPARRPAGPQVVQHRPHPGADAGGVLIIDRHQHRGRRQAGDGVRVDGRQRGGGGAAENGGEPQRRRPERQGDPPEQAGEQPRQPGPHQRVGRRDRPGERPRRRRGRDERERDEGRADRQARRVADRMRFGRGGGRAVCMGSHVGTWGGAATWRRSPPAVVAVGK